jgi:hypothetical protein
MLKIYLRYRVSAAWGNFFLTRSAKIQLETLIAGPARVWLQIEQLYLTKTY